MYEAKYKSKDLQKLLTEDKILRNSKIKWRNNLKFY